jgi:hypothetical protein
MEDLLRPPLGLLHVRLLSPHTCKTAAMKHSRNKAIFVLDFYYTELDARALNVRLHLDTDDDSVEQPNSRLFGRAAGAFHYCQGLWCLFSTNALF